MLSSMTNFKALTNFKFKALSLSLSLLLALFLSFSLTGCNWQGASSGGNEPPTFSVSFYDADLNLLEKYDNLPNGHEVDLAGNKTAYSVSYWYLANNSTSVTSHNLTSDVNFYAVSDVHEITNQEELAYINTNSTTLSGKYILLNDISLDDTQAGVDASGWNPIGKPSPFNGLFNGNGNTISNLWINRTSTSIVGLFGHAQNAQIRNLRVEAEEVKGNISVGIIAGRVDSSSISNSYSTGSVSGNSYAIGGIVGYVVDTPISNSYSNGSVNGEERVGGIAGFITASSSITNSYSTATVNGTQNVGGIAGYVYVSSSVTDSYSTGTISGDDYVGGIAGVVESSSAVTNNAAINPSVTGTSYINRIAGYIQGGATVTNNFALDTMNGTTSGGTSKTEAELKQETTYSDAVNGDGNGGLGWLFGDDDSNPWKIDEGNGYPYLYWQD